MRVRVVVDGFGSDGQPGPSLRRWFDGSGVALAVFRPIDRWYSWLQPGQLRRLHQKLMAADTEQAFVGGINIIDDRYDLNHGATRRAAAGFRGARCVARWSFPWHRPRARCGPAPRSAATGATR